VTAAAVVPERPILFSGSMVRATLDDRKTQTRRVAKHRRRAFASVAFDLPWIWARLIGAPGPDMQHSVRCPYGQPGDRLWVRETLRRFGGSVEYAADGDLHRDAEWVWKRAHLPSIHMPRGLSRLTLELTGVRVERVQDISEADAQAEGVERASDPDECTSEDAALNAECGYFPPRSYVDGYRLLWDSLNAARGYGGDANPWVWVLEFRRLAA
jgi:hypothetical protein